ncbi:hypothetical protein SUGI_0557650 [Cryptomeria japonica]|nr:hypothetical protein SUGI_0557650 [Cryptomeria japonica]
MAPCQGPWRPEGTMAPCQGPWRPKGTMAPLSGTMVPWGDQGAPQGPWRPGWAPVSLQGLHTITKKSKCKRIKSQMFSQLTSSSGSSSITAWRRISILVGRSGCREGMMMAMWAPLH